MTLTQEQIAQVARIVMGEDFPVSTFAPAFGNGLFYRSQALAIVEWLFKTLIEWHINLNITQHYYETYIQMVADYVHQKDVNALMEMVLELQK